VRGAGGGGGARAPGGLEAERADLRGGRAAPHHPLAAGLVGVHGRHGRGPVGQVLRYRVLPAVGALAVKASAVALLTPTLGAGGGWSHSRREGRRSWEGRWGAPAILLIRG
jgi:hypothetical protein